MKSIKHRALSLFLVFITIHILEGDYSIDGVEITI